MTFSIFSRAAALSKHQRRSSLEDGRLEKSALQYSRDESEYVIVEIGWTIIFTELL